MKTLRVACLYFGGDSQLKMLKVAEACMRWTPQIAVSNEAVFLEIGRCRNLYREDWLTLRLKALARKFDCDFKISFSESASQALAQCRWGSADTGGVESLPIEALSDYVNPFGADPETVQLAQEMAGTLRKLGMIRLGAFMAMSANVLPSRFGKLGLLLHQRMRGAASVPWPRFMPPERILEEVRLESSQPFHDLEPLFFYLKPAVDRAMSRLRGRYERAAVVRVRLQLERYSTLSREEGSRSWRLELALPQGSSVGLIPVLRERMEFDLGQKPLAAPVMEMEFEVLEAAPGAGAQRDFFDAKEEEVEAWNALVSRLVEKLGVGSVFRAAPQERYFPERSWVRDSWQENRERETSMITEDTELAQDPLPVRPLRLLMKPLMLQKSQGALIHFESSRRWRVVQTEGPELLVGEWWFKQMERSYFQVATDSGERLWVFQVPGSDAVFLHGIFD